MKTGIEIRTSFFPLAWFLFFCTPVIEINGQKNSRSWGTHFFDLPTGNYVVKIYFSYFGMPQCGANQVSLTVSEGESKKITFYMPPWMMAKGKIKII